MVHTNCYKYYETNNQISVNKDNGKRHKSGNIYEELLLSNFIFTCTVLVKRNLLELYDDFDLYMRNLFKMEDYPHWLEISRHTNIGYIDQPTATYRILKESASHSTDYNQRLRFLNSIHRVRTFFVDQYGCMGNTERKVYINYSKRRLILASFSSNTEMAAVAYHKLREFKLNGVQRLKFFAYLLGARFRLISWYLQKTYRN